MSNEDFGQKPRRMKITTPLLAVSIVLYQSNETEVKAAVLRCLKEDCVDKVYLIDNSPLQSTWDWLDNVGIEYHYNAANLGYGSAHNIALREIIETHPYVLVLNADVSFSIDTLNRMAKYMIEHPDIGLLSPKVFNEDGSVQHSVKLLPTPINLIARRFFLYGGLFGFLKRITTNSTEQYITRIHNHFLRKHELVYELGCMGYDKDCEVRYASGCFMLIRTEVLKSVGLFDERFFMYPEDIDISRRIARQAKVLFAPEFKITHGYGGGSYKSAKILYLHVMSMIKYFNKWGWFFDSERRRQNAEMLKTFRSNDKLD